MSPQLALLSQQVGQALATRGLLLACAESCTGGLVTHIVTHSAGSSQWFERGFITYSNQAKQDLLGVSASTLAEYGAVSETVASEMAVGALRRSAAQVALAITGIAGPDGGNCDKPVGLVCFAFAQRDQTPHTWRQQFHGHREQVRRQAAVEALETLLRRLG